MNTKQTVPAEIKVDCPDCNSTVYVLIEKLRRGEIIRCHKCQHRFDSAVLLKMVPDTKQDIKNYVTDRLESDPDRYMKEFAPLWKRFTLALKICLVLLAIVILIIFIAPSTNYYYISSGALLGSVFLCAFYYFKVRCPRCGQHIRAPSFSNIWMEGTCDNCGIRLKKRAVPVKIQQIIRWTILSLAIITMIALLYMQLTQGICIKITSS